MPPFQPRSDSSSVQDRKEIPQKPFSVPMEEVEKIAIVKDDEYLNKSTSETTSDMLFAEMPPSGNEARLPTLTTVFPISGGKDDYEMSANDLQFSSLVSSSLATTSGADYVIVSAPEDPLFAGPAITDSLGDIMVIETPPPPFTCLDLSPQQYQELTTPSPKHKVEVENSFSSCSPVDVGAEVVIEDQSDSPASVVMNTKDEFPSGQTSSTRELTISRRVSYEEVVHLEKPKKLEVFYCEEPSASCDTENSLSEVPKRAPSLEECIILVSQWALCLQEVLEDRESGTENSQTNCLCDKADHIMHQLRRVERCFMDIINAQDRSDFMGNFNITGHMLRDLHVNLREVQEYLRSSVSIRISSPSEDVRSKSFDLVAQVCDIRRYVRDAIDSVVQLVFDLLNVTNCKLDHSSEEKSDQNRRDMEDNEDDITERVASLRTSDDLTEDDDESENDKENQSCRKRNRPKTPPNSPTDSPCKRARKNRSETSEESDNPALELLESNRKGVRNHGLLKYVLWREALKAEKERVNVKNKRRVTFPL